MNIAISEKILKFSIFSFLDRVQNFKFGAFIGGYQGRPNAVRGDAPQPKKCRKMEFFPELYKMAKVLEDALENG